MYLNERGFGRRSNEFGFEVPVDHVAVKARLSHARAIHEHEGGVVLDQPTQPMGN